MSDDSAESRERIPAQPVPAQPILAERAPAERSRAERVPAERVPAERILEERILADRIPARAKRGDWLAFIVLAAVFGTLAVVLGWESTFCAESAQRLERCTFLAVAHWFDPVFFQYNLLLVLAAVLIVPAVTLAYVLTAAGRKWARLHDEVPPARRNDVDRRMRRRASFRAYLGSVLLTTMVVFLGASIILLFKPVPDAALHGVDFSRGANVLTMGPFIELFGVDSNAYYSHLTRSLVAFQFGFLGAYMYFIAALARAYFMLDLTPHTFVEGAVRMMGASVVALVLSFVPYGEIQLSGAAAPAPASANAPAAPQASAVAQGEPAAKSATVPLDAGLLAIVSFFFGFYPKRALLALEHVAVASFRWIASPEQYRAMPLSTLSGMSFNHEIRLEREGFDNLDNLSHADPVDLAVRTGFAYAQLADWISEARLANHLREDYVDFVRYTGITGEDQLVRFLSQWDAGRGEPVEQLVSGVPDAGRKPLMKAKLQTLAALLVPGRGGA